MADDPKDNVPDELEERLDDLSATLTDDDIETTGSTAYGSRGEVGDADMDDVDVDADDTDADADDTDV